MLYSALQTNIPLLGVTTNDELHVINIVSHLDKTKRKVKVTTLSKSGGSTKPPEVTVVELHTGKYDLLVYFPNRAEVDWSLLYASLKNRGMQMVVVNPPAASMNFVFDCGELPVPEELLVGFVKQYATQNVAAIVSSLQGLNLKQALEVATLSTTNGKSFSPKSIQEVRRGMPGHSNTLSEVSTDDDYFYVPEPTLVDWCEVDGKLFTGHEILQPRGLMFLGLPGVGKTLGAKYLARTLDIPLYKLEMGLVMNKYVGESEKNLMVALSTAETHAPCLLLVDEADKLFSTSDTGVSERALGVFLWWLQEHRTKVVTIMTSNNAQNIPPELYRPGRIDSVIRFEEISESEAYEFMKHLHSWWMKKLNMKIPVPEVGGWGVKEPWTYAAWSERYLHWLKRQYLKLIES